MNFKSAKTFKQPELLAEEASERTIVTHTSEEFFAVCEREKRGEITIFNLGVLKPNGRYRFHVKVNQVNPAEKL